MDNKDLRETEEQEEKRRRPYEHPAVSWEEDFEPYVFSTCGKMPGQGGACALMMSS